MKIEYLAENGILEYTSTGLSDSLFSDKIINNQCRKNGPLWISYQICFQPQEPSYKKLWKQCFLSLNIN